jgi:membrane protein required for colicin V production
VGWIDFVILLVIGLSIWSGYSGGAVRTTISIAGMIAGVEFASYNYPRFAKELAPMVHSLAVANAIWFLLQIFIVILAFGFLGNAIQNEIAWMETSSADGIVGGLLGLVRGIVLGAICIMSVAAFFPGADTLPGAFLPKYLAGTTAVLSNLTANAMQTKIITGIESIDTDATAPDTSKPDAIPPNASNP